MLLQAEQVCRLFVPDGLLDAKTQEQLKAHEPGASPTEGPSTQTAASAQVPPYVIQEIQEQIGIHRTAAARAQVTFRRLEIAVLDHSREVSFTMQQSILRWLGLHHFDHTHLHTTCIEATLQKVSDCGFVVAVDRAHKLVIS